MSAKTVGWFVLTARRGRTTADVSFAAVHGFARRGKLELLVFDDSRGFRGRFVEGWFGVSSSVVVRRGIASEHYALATGRARTVIGERIPKTAPVTSQV